MHIIFNCIVNTYNAKFNKFVMSYMYALHIDVCKSSIDQAAYC